MISLETLRMKEKIVNDKGIKVGVINDHNMYVTPRKSSIHFMFSKGGYGISEKLLLMLENKGVQDIRIIEDGRKVYKFTVAQYLLSKLTYVNKQDDLQYFVPLNKAK